MDVENACVSEIVVGGELSATQSQMIRAEYFYDPEHRKVFELIMKHFGKYRKVPSEEAVLSAYPNYVFDFDCPEPLDFYISEVRERHLYRLCTTGFTESVEKLSGEGPDAGQRAYDALSSALLNARMEVPVGFDEDVFKDSYDALMVDIEDRRLHGSMRGIDTGFHNLNKATGGLQPEQFITLVGLPGHGKSTMLLYLAYKAVEAGRKALLVTFEMSVREQRDRLVSLMAGVPLSNILSGQLTPKDQKAIKFAFSTRSALTERFILVHDESSMMTLSGVQAKINEYQPDVVVIDGVYFMDDEGGEPPGSPRALTNITRGLKRLSRSNKVCVLVSTQALAQKSRGGVGIHSAGYSSSFSQDSDVFLMVEKTEHPGISKFSTGKVRSGPDAVEYVKLAWDEGRIYSVDPALLGLGDIPDNPDVGTQKFRRSYVGGDSGG